MANRLVDAAASVRAVGGELSPERRDLPYPNELRARAARYGQLSETLVNPAVVEAVQACARELEAQASLQIEIIPQGSAQNLQGEKQPRRGARFSGSHGALPGIALVLLTNAGWCQHLYTCFNEGRWGFMIAGAILSPIGVMHGWGVWFGWW